MLRSFKARVAALEAAESEGGEGGEGVFGVLYENGIDGTPDGPLDSLPDAPPVGLVRVNGTGALLTPEEFAYDYPRGTIVRIRYEELP